MRERVGAALALAGLALGLTACSGEPEPFYPPDPEGVAVSTEYDPELEASAAVLPLVPEDATVLEVTDFDQLRLVLGFGDLDGDSPQADKDRFWAQVDDAATLSTGLLRPIEGRLRPFDLSQDDVAWEAEFGATGTDQWVLALHEDVPMQSVREAVLAKVGFLADVTIDEERHLISSGPLPEGDASWAAVPELHELVGDVATATYVDRSCLDFDDVFGAGMADQLAPAPAAELDGLDELEAFSISFGGELATVRLGEDRSDAFARMRISEVLPRTDPLFEAAFARPVADPAGGRIGFDLRRPADAVELTVTGHLPFALCGG